MARRNKQPLTEEQRRTRKLVWLVVAALIVAASITGLVWGLIAAGSAPVPADPTSEPTDAPTTSPSEEPPADGEVVDQSATENGWVPEPVTTSMKEYGVAAATAATTYDTTKATRGQFLDYLTTWFTPDYEIGTLEDRESALQGHLRSLDRDTIVPDQMWDEQALVKTIVTAEAEAVKIDYDHVSAKPDSLDTFIEKGFHSVTVDVVVTYSKVDSSTGDRFTYDDRFTISMQLQCGNSIPAESSGQTSADCKLIRFYDEPFV